AAGQIPVHGDIFKLLLLLGARRGEVAEARWSDFKGSEWTIPGERSKNHEPRTLPLPEQAMAIIKRQPKIAGSDFVFVKRHHFAAAKADLDRLMKPDTAFRTHDLRRTFASGMQRIGIPIHITERVLGHTSGSFRGIIGVYQQFEHADEMRHALQAWAD